MKVREIIRRLIAERYKSPREFAEKSGISYVYLNKVLNGVIRVNDEYVDVLSKALNIPSYQLFSCEPLVPKRIDEREPVIAQIFQDQDTAEEFGRTEGRDDFIPVRIVDTVSLGQGRIVSNEETKGYALIYKHALNRKAWTQKRKTEKIICVWADGDSMHPTIQDKSLIAIDIEDRVEIQKGKIYAVDLPDEGVTIKRVYRADDHLALFADNQLTPGFPRCISLSQNINPVRGRVVWTWNVLE